VVVGVVVVVGVAVSHAGYGAPVSMTLLRHDTILLSSSSSPWRDSLVTPAIPNAISATRSTAVAIRAERRSTSEMVTF
jgi:hypothetical protein